MSSIGGKAQGLIDLRDKYQATVPDFLLVEYSNVFSNFDSFRQKLEPQIGKYLASKSASIEDVKVSEALAELKLGEAVIQDVNAQILHKGWQKVSFRTSALNEDGPDYSFAGQYESYLDVEYTSERLREHALLTLKSMISPRVLGYAKERGLKKFELGGSMIIQEMFFGQSCGVIFSENGAGGLLIQVVDSWRNSVVEGEDATEIFVPRKDLHQANLPKYLSQLCNKVLEIEAQLGRPIDVEWSYSKGKLMFLQVRPVTVANLDYVLEWDLTNISENYPGITLPLTYSVIRELYSGVYQSFCRLIGVRAKLLDANQPEFRNMLGYLNGRVYYRITNWYVLLKLLPGRANQQFFEAMLNPVVTRGERAKTASRVDFATVLTLVRFVWLLLNSERLSKGFRDRFARELHFFKSYHVDYVNAAELMRASKQVRAKLLDDWAVPILNDVKLMVFHGLLKKYFFKTEDQTEYLAFLAGLTDRASLKPLERLAQLGSAIAIAMRETNSGSISELQGHASYGKILLIAEKYVNEFGSRTPGELKLESVRLTDDIEDVLNLALKAHESTFASYALNHAGNAQTKADAIEWPANITGAKKWFLKYVANNTKKAIDWRERFRFNRAQTFDLSRVMFDAIGKLFAREGILDSARDIYWLTEGEIDEIVNAHAWSHNAKEVVAGRKLLQSQYESQEMSLAMHGSGPLAATSLFAVDRSIDGSALAGKGVAPGVLTAPVVVCHEFDAATDVRGKILVVTHIDPGWTLLFTQAAGIIAERGNALSHAAIIAREIGIPAVVAAPKATSILETGDIVTINGTLGSITRETN